MTANRGLGGLAACPVCLIPTEQLADLSVTFDLRTAEDSKDSYLKVQGKTHEEVEKELKPKGLRFIYVFNLYFCISICI